MLEQTCIYIRIPRTASLMLKRMFRRRGYKSNIDRPDAAGIIECYGTVKEHYDAKIRRHIDLWNSAFKFAVVRNPWDRFVSGWRYLKQVRNMPLKDLLGNLDTMDMDEVTHVHLRMQQMDFLFDGNIDFFLRFEHLQRDFDALCDCLGIPTEQLRVQNATKHEHYSTYYDEEDVELLRGHFHADVEAFDYDFEAPTCAQPSSV